VGSVGGVNGEGASAGLGVSPGSGRGVAGSVFAPGASASAAPARGGSAARTDGAPGPPSARARAAAWRLHAARGASGWRRRDNVGPR
jgi:hypothetical protein